MFVLLWTDILFYLQLLSILGFIFYVQKSSLQKEAWQKVFHRPLAAFSFVILLSFLLIALLDSIHFHPALSLLPNGPIFYANEVKSLLDVLLSPLGQQSQNSYSAPFAVFLGRQQHWVSITQSILFSIFKAAVLWVIVVAMLLVFCARKTKLSFFEQCKRTMQNKTITAWRAIFIALGLVFTVTAVSLDLSKSYHILGTSLVGQDIFYAAIKSIRTGLIIGTLTTLFMLPFATIAGTCAGYFSGWIDDIIQYIYITLSSIPGVLLITAAILALQLFMQTHAYWFSTLAVRADARLLILCAILGVTGWTDLCRLLRGETLKLREIDFVQAAVVMGVPSYKIIFKHILPNVTHIILITVVLNFSGLVLAEAVLSYVGVGVDPSTISWGNMINSARMELAREPVVWWPLFAAFIFMFTLVFSANLFADAVRDAFDPRRSAY